MTHRPQRVRIVRAGAIALLAGGALGSGAEARTIEVGTDFPTLGEAILASASGDVIELPPGIYSAATNGERFPIELRGRRLSIRGADGVRTILDAGGAARHLHCVDDSSTIEGLTLRGGLAAGPGGSLLAESSRTVLRRLRFLGCRSESEGDAVACIRSEATLDHALFVGNGGMGPTVVLEGGASRVAWSTFDENAGAAILLRTGRPVVESCVIARPGSPAGPRVGILLERLAGAASPVRGIAYLECGERTRPARDADSVRGVAGFVDRGREDFRLVASDGTRFANDPVGAFGGTGALEAPSDRGGRGADGAETSHLGPVVPNPFSPSTSIPYTVDAASVVDLGVFNVLGQRIRTLYAGDREPGTYREVWDGRDDLGQDMPAGVYYARVTRGRATETQPIVLVR